MAYSTQRVTSDGTLSVLAISIEYFERPEISVLFNGLLATSGWSWVGITDKALQFVPDVPAGVEVTVVRKTDLEEMRHRFGLGAAFKAANVDENFNQILHVAQESQERPTYTDLYNDLNMHGFNILNLGDGQKLTDIRESAGAGLSVIDNRLTPTLNTGNLYTTDQTVSVAWWANAFSCVRGSTPITISLPNAYPNPWGAVEWADRYFFVKNIGTSVVIIKLQQVAHGMRLNGSTSGTVVLQPQESTGIVYSLGSNPYHDGTDWYSFARESGDSVLDAGLDATGDASALSVVTAGTTKLSIAADVAGTYNFGGTAPRIIGDLSTATHSNRLMFQSSTTNGASGVGAVPNGTAQAAAFTAYNSSDPDNAATTQINVTGTQSKVTAGKTGTGTYKPLALNVGGADVVTYSEAAATLGSMTASVSRDSGLTYRLNNSNVGASASANFQLTSNAGSLVFSKMSSASGFAGGTSISNTGGSLYLGTADTGSLLLTTNNAPAATLDSAGNFLLNKATGGLGYGAGAGGSVTQTTSRTTTTPAINFPNGDITLFTAAGSATPTSFSVANTQVAAKDVPTIAVRGATNKYITQVTNVVAGTSFEVTFWTTGGTAVDTPIFHFNLGKGS